jgi:hypothetical protein
MWHLCTHTGWVHSTSHYSAHTKQCTWCIHTDNYTDSFALSQTHVSIIDTESIDIFQVRNRELQRDSRLWPGVSHLFRCEARLGTHTDHARLQSDCCSNNGSPRNCLDLSTAHWIYCRLRVTGCLEGDLKSRRCAIETCIKILKLPDFKYRQILIYKSTFTIPVSYPSLVDYCSNVHHSKGRLLVPTFM